MDHPVNSLEQWLAQATAELCDEAQQRIHAEMEAHVAEATEAQIAAGKSEAEAQQRALNSLGDPLTARRAFRHVYLTEAQARHLEGVKQVYGPGKPHKAHHIILLFGLVYFLILRCVFPGWHDVFSLHGLLWLITLIPIWDPGRRVQRFLFKVLKLPQAVLSLMLWDQMKWVPFYLVVGTDIRPLLTGTPVNILLPLIAFLVFMILHNLYQSITRLGPIWLKVRRHHLRN